MLAIAAMVGALLPLVISLFKQSTWSTQVKKYFAFAVSVVAAIITTGATEGWSALNWANLVAVSCGHHPARSDHVLWVLGRPSCGGAA